MRGLIPSLYKKKRATGSFEEGSMNGKEIFPSAQSARSKSLNYFYSSSETSLLPLPFGLCSSLGHMIQWLMISFFFIERKAGLVVRSLFSKNDLVNAETTEGEMRAA